MTEPNTTFAPRRAWIGVAALILIANGGLVAVLLTRARRRVESRASFSEFFRCRPEEVAITVRAADGGPGRTSGGDVERLRAELRDDVVISEREHRELANRVIVLAAAVSDGTLTLPNGVAADWHKENDLMIRYSPPGQKDATRTLFLAPRTWLQ